MACSVGIDLAVDLQTSRLSGDAYFGDTLQQCGERSVLVAAGDTTNTADDIAGGA